MEKKRTIIMLIVIVIVLSCLHMVKRYDFYFNIGNEMTLVNKYEVNAGEVNQISLNLYSTDIIIKKSNNEKILVEYYSNQDKNAVIEYENETIMVDETEYNEVCVGICNIERKLILYIPSSFDGMYDFVTTSGDTKSEIVFLNNDTNIMTTSGDIALDVVNDVNITTVSGDVHISGVTNALDVTTTSGDVYIGVLDNKEYSNIATTSGDVKIDTNKSDCYIQVETTSGDRRINKSNRKSDIVLNIKTTSGDVKVN